MLLPRLPAFSPLPLLSKLPSNNSPLPCSSLVYMVLLPSSSLQTYLQLLSSTMLFPCLPAALTLLPVPPNLPPVTPRPCPLFVSLPLPASSTLLAYLQVFCTMPLPCLRALTSFLSPLTSSYLTLHAPLYSYFQSLHSRYLSFTLLTFTPPPVRPARQDRRGISVSPVH